jgi:hypothetical protein
MAEHTYPSRHKPGTHWATDKAWEILDSLPVGILPEDYRFLTAGRIAGALIKASEESRASALNHTRALERGR